MITIRNGNLFGTIDEGRFALLQSRGKYKGWKKIESYDVPVTADIKRPVGFDQITVSQLKTVFDTCGIVYDKKCNNKKKLYNLYIKNYG